MPLAEDAEQRPLTFYAASKAAQEVDRAADVQRERRRAVICTRSFNHSGVGQAAEYLLPSLVGARACAERATAGDALSLGNDVVRDYLARERRRERVSRARRARTCRRGVQRVQRDRRRRATAGRPMSCFALACAADISTAPSLVRATDIPALIGSPAKLMRDTGWTPRKTHADIIDDLLNAATD